MTSTTPHTPDPTDEGRVDPAVEVARAVITAAAIAAGQRVLDVASGPGAAALRAAAIGAEVVAAELSPLQLAAGRRTAAGHGLSLEWIEADPEALPFVDDEFDTVVSVLGATLAPHPQQTADEIVRVCRPGGVIAIATRAVEPRTGPTRLPDASPPALWGREDHVRALFGERVTDLHVRPHDSSHLIITAKKREAPPCPAK